MYESAYLRTQLPLTDALISVMRSVVRTRKPVLYEVIGSVRVARVKSIVKDAVRRVVAGVDDAARIDLIGRAVARVEIRDVVIVAVADFLEHPAIHIARRRRCVQLRGRRCAEGVLRSLLVVRDPRVAGKRVRDEAAVFEAMAIFVRGRCRREFPAERRGEIVVGVQALDAGFVEALDVRKRERPAVADDAVIELLAVVLEREVWRETASSRRNIERDAMRECTVV